MENNSHNKFNGYNPYNTYEGYELNKKGSKKTDSSESAEPINIKIDKKGKGHEKAKPSEHYGFIGSSSSTKYSNPYDNNPYGNYSTPKKEKSKKDSKKRSSGNSSSLDDVDVTQAGLSDGTAAVPVVLYPQQIATVPTVYYTTPVATPVAIQYVNSPTIGYQESSNSSSTELTKEKKETKRMISYYADKENATEEIVKSNDKEKELEEIMNELGMKPKSKEPTDLKSRLLRNQLFIFVAILVIIVILIVLYFVWPRLPEIIVTEFELQPNGIQYKLPMNIEYRDSYNDLKNVTSSDTDSYVQFNMVVHFDVRNDNFIPYSFNSLFIEYVLKAESLSNNVLLGDSYVNSISFGPRKNALMTITTSLKYASPSMKNDNTFKYILDRCGITSPGSDMDLDYKVSMKIPVISIIYRPNYIKTTQFKCPFLTEDKYKVVEKKKDDDEEDDNKDKDNKKDSDSNGDGENKD